MDRPGVQQDAEFRHRGGGIGVVLAVDRTVPLVGRSRPAIIRMVVDFPPRSGRGIR